MKKTKFYIFNFFYESNFNGFFGKKYLFQHLFSIKKNKFFYIFK